MRTPRSINSDCANAYDEAVFQLRKAAFFLCFGMRKPPSDCRTASLLKGEILLTFTENLRTMPLKAPLPEGVWGIAPLPLSGRMLSFYVTYASSSHVFLSYRSRSQVPRRECCLLTGDTLSATLCLDATLVALARDPEAGTPRCNSRVASLFLSERGASPHPAYTGMR